MVIAYVLAFPAPETEPCANMAYENRTTEMSDAQDALR